MIRDRAYNKYRKNQLLNMFVEKKNVNEPSAFSKYLKLKIKPKPEPILVFFVWFWFFCLFVSLRYFSVILSLFILSQNTDMNCLMRYKDKKSLCILLVLLLFSRYYRVLRRTTMMFLFQHRK